MYSWDVLNEHGRCGMRGWYRKLRLIGLDRHEARRICTGTLHGVVMGPWWVDREGA